LNRKSYRLVRQLRQHYGIVQGVGGALGALERFLCSLLLQHSSSPSVEQSLQLANSLCGRSHLRCNDGFNRLNTGGFELYYVQVYREEQEEGALFKTRYEDQEEGELADTAELTGSEAILTHLSIALKVFIDTKHHAKAGKSLGEESYRPRKLGSRHSHRLLPYTEADLSRLARSRERG
jgi:hypothetical protein